MGLLTSRGFFENLEFFSDIRLREELIDLTDRFPMRLVRVRRPVF